MNFTSLAHDRAQLVFNRCVQPASPRFFTFTVDKDPLINHVIDFFKAFKHSGKQHARRLGKTHDPI